MIRGPQNVLEIVHQEQHFPGSQKIPHEICRGRGPRRPGNRKRFPDRNENIVGGGERHEIDEGDPVREQPCPHAGRFHSQSCLADPGQGR